MKPYLMQAGGGLVGLEAADIAPDATTKTILQIIAVILPTIIGLFKKKKNKQ